MGSFNPSLKRTTSAENKQKSTQEEKMHLLALTACLLLVVKMSEGAVAARSGSPKPREPLGMSGPGHWFEPHPRGRLEHPWSLRAGTLRAQKPTSLHFLCILWVSPSRVTLLSELNRPELALPLLLPKEHLPRQARRPHQPHQHRRL